MSRFILADQGETTAFFYEQDAYPGVCKVADKVRHDIRNVTGKEPAAIGKLCKADTVVIFGTAERSRVLDQLDAGGQIDLGRIRGQREVYLFQIVPDLHIDGAAGIKEALVIAGSDKRGTIYGLFHISELLGVSPFTDWSQVMPPRRDSLIWDERVNLVSKEPAVEYRGFFINDEWPAFGTWCTKHFGGFTAQMYDHVFEVLLRLRGNYLWPAMWSSSFSLDGPGLASAQLADEYGIVMGLSHHEPCLRHGEEYSKVRGQDSIYGDAWDFRTNRDGITRFWEDGLRRNGQFENVITMGMRGERDSVLLGDDASLEGNIALLKKVIHTQNELIRKNVCPDLHTVPRMLALYKEVEPFFYGSEDVPGLKEDRELEDVIFLLCDDNHGWLRTLPDEDMRRHPGGYGMYYHFDYHGSPVSYEWTNSTWLPQVWEQMTAAYEYGIRRLWIVNVGDLAFQELPLSYFMDLAFDYDTWGISAPDAATGYIRSWIQRQFADSFTAADQEVLLQVIRAYTGMNNNCRPEHLSARTYQAEPGGEAYEILAQTERVITACEDLSLRCRQENRAAFEELVYYNAVASMNLHRMWAYTALNHFLASRGALIANDYAEKVRECLRRDEALKQQLHQEAGGKWDGFALAAHIGFCNWNDEEAANPVLMQVLPVQGTRLIACVQGSRETTCGGEWTGKRLVLDVFGKNVNEAEIRLLAGGSEDVHFTVKSSAAWAELSLQEGTVGPDMPVKIIRVSRKQVVDAEAQVLIRTRTGQITVVVKNRTQPGGRIVISADEYTERHDTQDAGYRILQETGRSGAAIRVYPVTEQFMKGQDRPSVSYAFRMEAEGNAELAFELRPSNPWRPGRQIHLEYALNGEEIQKVMVTAPDYQPGISKEWEEGVIRHIRTCSSQVCCRKGRNVLTIYATDPEVLLERIVCVRL